MSAPSTSSNPAIENLHALGIEGAVRIISIKEDRTFSLHAERLQFVLDKVERQWPGTPVAVVSVVGAFRTGKSFLLDLFLRYLRHGAADARARGARAAAPDADAGGGAGRAEWLTADGDVLEGNAAAAAPDYSSGDAAGGAGGAGSAARAGFKWRHGNERQTTGMWLWSEPFLRRTKAGKDVAVLLMDTQGLFDSKTTQLITTQIFGLATLLSSYQIYNISTRLTEDVLQNVAVFAEFARIAADADPADAEPAAGAAAGAEGEAAPPPPPAAPAAPRHVPSVNYRGVNREAKLRELAAARRATAGSAEPPEPVFQRLEFLVRDSVVKSLAATDGGAAEMSAYINTKFSEMEHDDLRVVREQVRRRGGGAARAPCGNSSL
jgi:hypothetical protein